MASEYILIDYENVQPKNLELLEKHSFRVLVFMGANQTRVSREFLKSILLIKEKAEVIEVSGTGRNALDFHIAFYLGELAAKDSEAQFHVISRDTGFDPLITHLNARGIRIRRETDLAEIPSLRLTDPTSKDEKIAAIVKNLAGRGQSRPRKTKTLANTINSLFVKKLEPSELDALIAEMQGRGLLVINEGAVSYRLPG